MRQSETEPHPVPEAEPGSAPLEHAAQPLHEQAGEYRELADEWEDAVPPADN